MPKPYPRPSSAFHEIARWRATKCAAKHAGEGARAGIAEIQRDAGDRLRAGKPRQRLEEPRLLPPGAEAHSGLPAKKSREVAARGAGGARPLVERATDARRAMNGLADAQ